MEGRKNFRRKRTKKQRRKSSLALGEGDIIETISEIKTRRWMTKQLLNKHKGSCAICGESVQRKGDGPLRATMDHIIPLSKGGQDILSNLQLACRACNEKKGDTL